MAVAKGEPIFAEGVGASFPQHGQKVESNAEAFHP